MNVKAKTTTGVMAMIIAAVFIAAILIPALAAAMPGPKDAWQAKGMDRPRPWTSSLGIWRNLQLVEKLALTSEQVNQLRTADFSARETRLETRAQLDRLKLQMDKAFNQDSIDQAAVRQLARQMADVKGRLLVQGVESRLTVGQILNADQISMLKQHEMQRRHQGSKGGNRCSNERQLAQR